MVKKILLGLFLFFLVAVFPKTSFALELDRDVTVEAGVGDSFLTVTGIISPFASLVLDTNGSFLASSVADSEGDFSFVDIRVKDTLESFCLKAVDFKRVGESVACIEAQPVLGRLEKHDIYLPPTIGLSRIKVAEGDSVSIFGYGMPDALAIVHIEGRGDIEAQADATGYYETELENLERGKYVLYATAKLEEKESLIPVSRIELTAESGFDSFLNRIIDFIKWLIRLVTSISIFVWIILAIIILIFILLFLIFRKRKKKKNQRS